MVRSLEQLYYDSRWSIGNGLWESTTFNSRLQPEQIALGTSQNGTNKLQLNYGYGGSSNNGNVMSQTITVPTVGGNAGFTATHTYNYDALNRLKDAAETIGGSQSWKQTFSYDRYGNRRFDLANGGTTVPAPGCAEAICNPQINTGNNRLVGYGYDSAGNTTNDAEGRSFTYDAENKQKTVVQNGITRGEYWYDGDGKRVKKKAYDSGGTLTEETIFVHDAAGKLIAEHSTNVADAATAKVAYLTNDHLGSPRINTDLDGRVTARHDYHPFGEEISTSQRTAALGYSADTVRKQFTGYERDIESELDFAQARYYNKQHGRFTSPDHPFADQFQSNPQSWSLYAYARNNPLNLTDPLGMAAACPPGWEGCIERDGKFYWIDEDGVESEINTEVITVETKIPKQSVGGSSPLLLVTVPCPSSGCGNPDPGILPVPMGGVVNKGIGAILSRIARFFGFGKAAPQFANGITREILQQAASSPGPTVRVVTNLTQAPQAGRALSVAVGEGAENLANAARSGGRSFTANIPKALVENLKTAGLVEERMTLMRGAKGTELYFKPEAAEFIVKFFH